MFKFGVRVSWNRTAILHLSAERNRTVLPPGAEFCGKTPRPITRTVGVPTVVVSFLYRGIGKHRTPLIAVVVGGLGVPTLTGQA